MNAFCKIGCMENRSQIINCLLSKRQPMQMLCRWKNLYRHIAKLYVDLGHLQDEFIHPSELYMCVYVFKYRTVHTSILTVRFLYDCQIKYSLVRRSSLFQSEWHVAGEREIYRVLIPSISISFVGYFFMFRCQATNFSNNNQ
jgi:hypothetical protein